MLSRRIRVLVVSMCAGALLAAGIPVLASVSHWPLLCSDVAFGDMDLYVSNNDAAPFNTATADTEMANGRLTWNNVSAPPELIDSGGALSMSAVPCGTFTGVPAGRAYVKGCPMSGSGFSWFTTGFTNGKEYIIRGLVGMDTTPSGFTWHISSSTAVAAGKKDLRGAVAHELGHMHGASHIDLDCEALAAQTMCSFHSTATAKYRSAQSHEVADWKARDALQ